MPLSLTTLAPGAITDASTLRLRISSAERYLNEQIAVGDRTTNWLNTLHVFGPEFSYAGLGRVPMPSGERYWATRVQSDPRRQDFYFGAFTTAVWVPGLVRTIQLAEAIAGTGYRVLILASFYTYEYGGDGSAAAAPIEYAPEQACSFDLYINDTVLTGTNRRLFRSSQAAGTAPALFAFNGALWARKQHSMIWAEDGTIMSSAGTWNVGVRVTPISSAGTNWKHVFVDSGNLVIRYFLR